METVLRDLVDELKECGLDLNINKCVVQSNTDDLRPVRVADHDVKVVPSTEGFRILGTHFCLKGRCAIEIGERIAAGWAKFYQLWPLLSPKRGDIRKRMQLFDRCVTASVL